MSLVPVLLAGGRGSRLWPLSRESMPKQFVPILDNQTTFVKTAQRFVSEKFASPIVITNEAYRFVALQQLDKEGVEPKKIILEPCGRGTAPALLTAAIFAQQENPDAVLVVAPTDHHIPNLNHLLDCLECAHQSAILGNIVCLGVKPTRPETGYGYIEIEPDARGVVNTVKNFFEKPNEKLAKSLISSGNCLWNAGLFVFSAGALIEAFKSFANEIVSPTLEAFSSGSNEGLFLRLEPTAWAGMKTESFDRRILEKAANVKVVSFLDHWSDIGDWQAVQTETSAVEVNVALSNRCTSIGNENVLLRSEDEAVHVVGVGLKDTIVVATKDAVLVSHINQSQHVSKAVDKMREMGISQACESLVHHRPWGTFEILTENIGFKVKRIIVSPGGTLSLQSHKKRAEHWVVVKGSATVEIDKKVFTLIANESVYIPTGSIHRLANETEGFVEIIEVQTGSYLGEDDIQRYDDVYDRG